MGNSEGVCGQGNGEVLLRLGTLARHRREKLVEVDLRTEMAWTTMVILGNSRREDCLLTGYPSSLGCIGNLRSTNKDWRQSVFCSIVVLSLLCVEARRQAVGRGVRSRLLSGGIHVANIVRRTCLRQVFETGEHLRSLTVWSAFSTERLLP
jgi:hypothetical protein